MPGLALEAKQHRTDPAMREHRFAVGRHGDDHARKTVLTLEEGYDEARIVGLLVAAEQERGLPARVPCGLPHTGSLDLAIAGQQSQPPVARAAPQERLSDHVRTQPT